MRKVPIVVLSVLLAAAIIFSIAYYTKYGNTKEVLSASEKRAASLDAKIVQLSQEKTALEDRIGKRAEHLEALKSAEGRISELEEAIRTKSQLLAELEKKHLKLKRESEENAKTIAALRAEGLSKDQLVSELRTELEGAWSELGPLKEELASFQEGKDAQVAKLKAKLEEATSEVASLNEEIAKVRSEKDVQMAKLRAELEKATSEVTSLHEEVAKVRSEKDAQLAKLKEELEGARPKIASAREELVGSQKEIDQLKRSLSDVHGERAQLKTQMDRMKTTYDAMVSDLKNQIQNKEVTISTLQEKLSVTFVDRVVFESGKAEITPHGRAILTKVGNILKTVEAKQIRIIGHTDNKPILPGYQYKFPSNWELSAARAAAVVRYFQKEVGLDPENLEAVGRSFYEPVASNETEEGRSQNRRVRIIIAPKIK
jgi:chemotaxis protein MotB